MNYYLWRKRKLISNLELLAATIAARLASDVINVFETGNFVLLNIFFNSTFLDKEGKIIGNGCTISG